MQQRLPVLGPRVLLERPPQRLMLGAPAAVAQARKRQFAPLFLYIAWAHLALTSQRNIPFFMIVMAPPVALWLEQVVATLAHPPLPDWIRRPAVAFERSGVEFSANDRIPRFYVISVAILVLLWLVLRAPGTPPSFQPGYDPTAYPDGALASLRQMDSSGSPSPQRGPSASCSRGK